MSKSIFAIAVVLSFLWACQSKKSIKGDYAIQQVNVIPMNTDTVLENQLVVVKNGVFQYVGEEQDIDFDVNEVINGKHKYLMPGLADMHVHLPEQELLDWYLMLNLKKGVTTLRVMRGEDWHLDVRNQLRKGEKQSPNMICSAPPIRKSDTSDILELEGRIAEWSDKGYDFIKVLSLPDTFWFDALMNFGNKYDMKVCGHVDQKVGLSNTIQADYASIEHLGGYLGALMQADSQDFQNLITETAQHEVYNCCTFDWYQLAYNQFTLSELKHRPGLDEVPDSLLISWQRKIEEKESKPFGYNGLRDSYKSYWPKIGKIVMELARAKAPLLISPDASGPYQVPGYAMLEEMKHHKMAGLNNFQIIEAATVNAARYLGEETTWGTIEEGKLVNAILLSNNPMKQLEHIQQVERVFMRNKQYDTTTL